MPPPNHLWPKNRKINAQISHIRTAARYVENGNSQWIIASGDNKKKVLNYAFILLPNIVIVVVIHFRWKVGKSEMVKYKYYYHYDVDRITMLHQQSRNKMCLRVWSYGK